MTWEDITIWADWLTGIDSGYAEKHNEAGALRDSMRDTARARKAKQMFTSLLLMKAPEISAASRNMAGWWDELARLVAPRRTYKWTFTALGVPTTGNVEYQGAYLFSPDEDLTGGSWTDALASAIQSKIKFEETFLLSEKEGVVATSPHTTGPSLELGVMKLNDGVEKTAPSVEVDYLPGLSPRLAEQVQLGIGHCYLHLTAVKAGQGQQGRRELDMVAHKEAAKEAALAAQNLIKEEPTLSGSVPLFDAMRRRRSFGGVTAVSGFAN